MKKVICLLLGLFFLLAAGCRQAEPEPLEFSEPTFLLSALPELEAHTQRPEIYGRYGTAEYVDMLEPAADYGALYPYVGQVLSNEVHATEMRYGLVDLQGRIVVDAVYDSVSAIDDAYWHMSYPVDESNAEARQLREVSEGGVLRGQHQFTTLDGSWVSPLYYGDQATISEGYVVVNNMEMNSVDEYWNGTAYCYFRVYDDAGQFLFEQDGYCEGFYEGLAVVNVRNATGNGDGNNYYYNYYYINTAGEIVIPGPFSYAERFENGRASVTTADAASGEQQSSDIDRWGNTLDTPDVNTDSATSNYRWFSEEDRYGVLDRAGKQIVPAIYEDVILGYWDNTATVCVAKESDEVYLLIDLESGERWPIEQAPDSIVIGGGQWSALRYDPPDSPQDSQGTSAPNGGIAIYERERQVAFFDDQGYNNLDVDTLGGGLFAISYSTYTNGSIEKQQTLLYDGEGQSTLATIEGWSFYSNYIKDGEYLLFYDRIGMYHYQITNHKGEFLFAPEVIGWRQGANDITYLRDDIFQVSIGQYYGLLRESGEWLILLRADKRLD